MGLDQHAFKSKIEPKHTCNFRDWYHPLTGEEGYYTNEQVDTDGILGVPDEASDDTPTPDILIAYWRGHYKLQEWMQNLYDAYDGKAGDVCHFNQNSVELSKEDLEELRDEVMSDSLPSNNHPRPSMTWQDWYGGKEGVEKQKQEDLAFIDKALKAIDDGYHVYYKSWW